MYSNSTVSIILLNSLYSNSIIIPTQQSIKKPDRHQKIGSYFGSEETFRRVKLNSLIFEFDVCKLKD